MHEFGMCQAIIDAVERRAEGRRVTGVRLRVGARHGVVGAAFNDAFALAAGGTVAEGASVDLVVVPVELTCGSCGTRFEAEDPFTRCGGCGGIDLESSGGDELLVESIRVETPVC